MCGIFALLHPTMQMDEIIHGFQQGMHRGPDQSVFYPIDSKVWMGFHRLAINGLDDGKQPFGYNGIYLICNGEIYNYKELYETMNVIPITKSDCEVLLHLYERYGIEQAVHMIDASEFAFVLYDSNNNVCYAGRDPYGVRPLFRGEKDGMICFASEMKMMPPSFTICPVLPSTIVECSDTIKELVYKRLPAIQPMSTNPHQLIRDTLYQCVKKRVMNTERPMACLLSGGLDSSLIATLVNQARLELGIEEPLETYSIGLEGAEDLKYASIMAKFLGSNHTSVIVTEQDFLSSIPEVIHALESRDTTTVRASVGNFAIAKYISLHSDAKILFNGDGSDEVCGGYLYMKLAPDKIEFDKECRRLVTDIHLFDALRSDRCISHHGLEARTPFLDKTFVEMYLSIPVELRFTECEKYLLRKSFEGYMPDSILWRKKEAFSDGVSSLKKSWFSIIQESIPESIQYAYRNDNSTLTMEQYYYKTLYDSFYTQDWLPYYWMPKYTDAKDCSARTLVNY
jgi:asparagine synthase (glutamine-hydrolysing)